MFSLFFLLFVSFFSVVFFFFFFFFKQKTAYEMRISDWSSDVCSSDLSFRTDFPSPPVHAYDGGNGAQRRCGQLHSSDVRKPPRYPGGTGLQVSEVKIKAKSR